MICSLSTLRKAHKSQRKVHIFWPQKFDVIPPQLIWFPLCRWNCRISNICFDFFNCACLKKTITNIRNSTGPNSKYVDELPRTLVNDKSTVTSSYFCGCLRIYELYNSYHLFWNQIGSNWIKLDQTGSNWIKFDQIGTH